MTRITVVGAGVVGLTTALELVNAGHEVSVVAKAAGANTTSGVAAAVWFPYNVGPIDRVALWAERTRGRLTQMAAAGIGGVDLLTGYECATGPGPPWWAPGAGGVVRARAPVVGEPEAFRFVAPRADSRRFLPHILSQLMPRLAHPIAIETVSELSAMEGDRIINCTGLGAADLASDGSVTALRGQVVIVEPGDIPLDITYTDDRGVAPIFYAIPRGDEVVLGGSAEPTTLNDPCTPCPRTTERILAQCAAVGWTPGKIREVKVGLRPKRAQVRLEADRNDPRVIHNYGHGGAGFTLCFGCAEEVARLVQT